MVLDAVKKRDVSVDILKFFAVILITNSHMAHLYVKFSALATDVYKRQCLFNANL